ncbi:hypothetical protein KIPB_013545, partial [Kipferlia bialata]|eukprot:g13545.t1
MGMGSVPAQGSARGSLNMDMSPRVSSRRQGALDSGRERERRESRLDRMDSARMGAETSMTDGSLSDSYSAYSTEASEDRPPPRPKTIRMNRLGRVGNTPGTRPIAGSPGGASRGVNLRPGSNMSLPDMSMSGSDPFTPSGTPGSIFGSGTFGSTNAPSHLPQPSFPDSSVLEESRDDIMRSHL